MQTYSATLKGPLVTVGYIDPQDTTPIEVFWGAPVFVPNSIYLKDSIMRPAVANGYYYKCVTTGLAGEAPSIWDIKRVTSGQAVFKAISYDLFISYDEIILSSAWEATQGVTLVSEAFDTERTGVVVAAIPNGVTSFQLTNQVVKTGNMPLSRTFVYTINQQ